MGVLDWFKQAGSWVTDKAVPWVKQKILPVVDLVSQTLSNLPGPVGMVAGGVNKFSKALQGGDLMGMVNQIKNTYGSTKAALGKVARAHRPYPAGQADQSAAGGSDRPFKMRKLINPMHAVRRTMAPAI